MNHAKPAILQVNTYDRWGGAERVASDLLREYRRRGHRAHLAVGRKLTPSADVIQIPRSRVRTAPGRRLDALRGIESFRYPATARLLDLPPDRPDVLHLHNLHGGYFDLRELARLSGELPVLLTLHDAWLLSGHCAHSFGCERWRNGCGHCPDLTIYPPVRRDATAANWARKRDVYARSRLHVAAPSRWLMERVERSMLAEGAGDLRVIPNGVDHTVFAPGDVRAARRKLGVPEAAVVLLFSASGITGNSFKDYPTVRAAAGLAADGLPHRDVVVIVLGSDGEPEASGRATVRFVPFRHDQAEIAECYRAADLYLHAARAETFPLAILEALACATPVVATAVGGIPEQIRSADLGAGDWRRHPDREATGVLVAQGDAQGMARAVVALLRDGRRLEELGANARADACRRFRLDRQADAYLDWYGALLDSSGSSEPRRAPGGAV
jgi:glycosyltransferase involved in cell wall biosynthesis